MYFLQQKVDQVNFLFDVKNVCYYQVFIKVVFSMLRILCEFPSTRNHVDLYHHQRLPNKIVKKVHIPRNQYK